MKASDYIAQFLAVQKTPHVFEVAGGMITHLLDSLYRLGNTTIVSVHHEQAAAFAADAYGRSTGRPCVAMATSGPGATNLLTGIASCYFDSSPALFITGQVNTHEQKGDSAVRQLGFQETDIISMAKAVTKKCFQVTRAEELEHVLHEAYALTMEGRPGPVLIDLPMNIQRADITVGPISYIEKKGSTITADADSITTLFDSIQHAKRPLILVGNGITCGRAMQLFRQFVDCLHIPVVASLLAVDTLAFNHPQRVGMIGSYGNRWANMALGTADVLIVIGSRLDIRQTGADVAGFSNNKKIFHIDCDASEINNRIKGCIPIVADVNDILNQALQKAVTYFASQKQAQHTDWFNHIEALKKQWPDVKELDPCTGINPNIFMHDLAASSKAAAAFVADVGNHQMWAAQSLALSAEQLFITSGGMGAMGFALPAGMGATLALQQKPVVVIAGDGAFQMNIQELQTIVRNKLPVKIIILNNQALGMIRQFQDSYFEGRYQSTYWGYSAPDFAAVAEAYGMVAKTISEPSDVVKGCEWLWNDPNEAALLQVMIDPHTNVYPKIAFGKPITEMEPFAKPNEMEST
jgi:acetolactate synthase-1/2/3 large subunit